MFNWNAEQYAKFKRERTLPASDLANAIECENVRSVLDIGCGIGNSTAVLTKKFPGAKIVGVDNSDDMLAAARENNPGLEFIKLDAGTELGTLTERFDVVFSNACIQWIPDHRRLLAEMFSLLTPGGVLAVQTPLQAKHPVHAIIQEVSKSEKWQDKILPGRLFYNLTEEEHFDVLSALTGNFRLWEITYFHKMPSYESIVEWYKGTGLRPYLEQLSPDCRDDYLRDILARIKSAYPTQANGEIIFRFPRLFFTAQRVSL